MSNVRTGVIVLTAMGILWWAIGGYSIPLPWKYAVLGLGLLLAGLLLGRSLLMPARLHKLDRTLFLLSVLFEALATAACVWALIKLRMGGYIFPAIAIIVGLHFIGMWKASDRTDCLWLAALLCVIAIAVLPLPLPLRNQSLGFSVAATLWICAALRMKSGNEISSTPN